MVPEAWNEPGNAGVVRKRYIDRSVLLYIYIYIYIYICACCVGVPHFSVRLWKGTGASSPDLVLVCCGRALATARAPSLQRLGPRYLTLRDPESSHFLFISLPVARLLLRTPLRVFVGFRCCCVCVLLCCAAWLAGLGLFLLVEGF